MELDQSGFDTQSPTLYAGNIGDDKYIIQITKLDIRLMEGSEYDIHIRETTIYSRTKGDNFRGKFDVTCAWRHLVLSWWLLMTTLMTCGFSQAAATAAAAARRRCPQLLSRRPLHPHRLRERTRGATDAQGRRSR